MKFFIRNKYAPDTSAVSTDINGNGLINVVPYLQIYKRKKAAEICQGFIPASSATFYC